MPQPNQQPTQYETTLLGYNLILTQLEEIWKMTSMFLKMEDNLKKIEIEDDLKQLKQYNFENRRRS